MTATMSQLPAKRIGHSKRSLARLKILREAITLTLFTPFVVFYMRQTAQA